MTNEQQTKAYEQQTAEKREVIAALRTLSFKEVEAREELVQFADRLLAELANAGVDVSHLSHRTEMDLISTAKSLVRSLS